MDKNKARSYVTIDEYKSDWGLGGITAGRRFVLTNYDKNGNLISSFSEYDRRGDGEIDERSSTQYRYDK